MSRSTNREEFPEIIEAGITAIELKLDTWARHMAARYNAPVYLVGSTLHHPYPRDCDIRIIVEDTSFAARYKMRLETRDTEPHTALHQRGIVSAKIVPFDEDGPSQAWIDDVAKFNDRMSVKARLNMDIQIWPESKWCEPYPKPLLLAAPTPRWFIHNVHNPAPEALSSPTPEP